LDPDTRLSAVAQFFEPLDPPFAQLLGGHIEAVHEHRLCAAEQNGGGCRDKRHRDGYHFITGPNSGGEKPQVQGRCPAIDRKAMSRIAIGGKTLLKCRNLRPQHELRAVNCAGDRGIDLRFYLLIPRL
jgi:hypothetical protein